MGFTNKHFKKAMCMVLAATMVFSLFIFGTGLPEGEQVAVAVTLPPGVSSLAMVSDLDSSNFSFSNAIRPGMTDITFVNTPQNDGRVWTDKSVNNDRAFIYDTSGGVVSSVPAPANEFLVTLSALSQSINIQNIIVEPSDTVFVIDVSGSMVTNSVPGDGRSRIAVVIDALNDAINMLMTADPNNRVSVAIYGGQSVSSQNQARVYPILSLGRYDASTPIFSVSSSTVSVRSNVPALQRTFTVEGGTPTQLGIRRGGQILLDVDNTPNTEGGTMIDLGTAGSPYWVTRKPNIILMTDGEPTYAWSDYRMDGFANFQGTTTTANWYDVGNGSTGDMGLTALTVMTASYVKKLVRDHYYGTNPEYASRSVGFYTLGLGVNSSIANGMLDPYGPSASGVPNAQLVVQGTTNMLSVLDGFAPGSASVTFPAIVRGTSTTNPQRTNVTVSNTGGVLTCNYDTMSFTAMDKAGLDDAFSQITQSIVSQGNYSTNAGDGTAQYSGYLVFSDVIGEYMQFSGFVGTWYNNIQNNGNSFGSKVSSSAPGSAVWNALISSLQEHMTYPGGGAITVTDAQNLILSNIAKGNLSATSNKIEYYADFNRNFLGSAYTSTGADIAPGTAAARVELYTIEGPAADALDSSKSVDLMLLVFQVVNVLQPGNFANYFSTGTNLVSPLLRGDQIVRWYIPATLLPLRGVEQVTNSDGTTSIQVSEAVPLRVIYSVAPNMVAISGGSITVPGVTAQYMNANQAPGQNAYFFYTNRWRGADGRVSSTAPRNDPANMSQAFFEPSPSNQFYLQTLTRNTMLKQPNVTGPTGTSPWNWQYRRFNGPNGVPVEVQSLGNNGRITIQSQVPINVRKLFNFGTTGLTTDDLSKMTFTVVGADGSAPAVEVFRRVLDFNTDFKFVGTSPSGGEIYELNELLYVPPGFFYNVYESGGFAFGFGLTTIPIVQTRIPGLIPPHPDVYTLIADNTYNAETPDPGLYLQKVFHGLSPNEIAAITDYEIDLEFYTSGVWEVVNTYNKADFDAGIPPGNKWGICIEDLSAGEYRIVERIFDIDGYVLTVTPNEPFTLTAEDVDYPGKMIVIDNVYTKIVYSLDLTKAISGIVSPDADGNVIAPFDMAIKIERIDSTGSPAGFIETISYADLVANSFKMSYTNLLPGDYRVTEFGGSAEGFDGPELTINGVPVNIGTPVVFKLDSSNASISLGMANTYKPTTPPGPPVTPPPPAESLVIRKAITYNPAVTEEQRQQYYRYLENNKFEIVIVGPNGFNEKINLSDAIHGVVFENVTEGNYTISENNAGIPGFVFSSDPPLPITRYIRPDAAGAVTIQINNIYTPEKSPPSGDTRSMFVPIALLSFGVLCVTGAEVYRRRRKRVNTQ